MTGETTEQGTTTMSRQVSGDPAVSREDHGSVRVLLLNRPDRRNALDMPMRVELIRLLDEATADPGARAVVLAGAGGTFCAGGDLSSMRRQPVGESRQRLETAQRVARTIIDCPVPVIAAVEGHAIGAGLGIAAACDQIIAAADARFSASFLTVGLGADLGISWSLPRRIGLARARTMLLTGSTVKGTQAEAWGLADHVAEPGRALSEAITLATRLATGPPLAVAAVKRLLNHPSPSACATLDAELEQQAMLFDTADFAEGLAALRERRTACFIGQ